MKTTLALTLTLSFTLGGDLLAADRVVPDQYPTIQAAIDASVSGDKIYLDDGLYVEQIHIDGKNIQIFGGLATMIQPPAGFEGGIVTVTRGGHVGLYDIILDGAAHGGSEKFYGVYVKGAQATLENVIVQNLKSTSCSTCQVGLGAMVEPGGGEMSAITVVDSVFKTYQKGGIVARGDGTVVYLEDSAFIGSGDNPHVVQNGIQINDGAGGLIQGCYVSNHRYATDQWGASGILLRNAQDIEVYQNLSQGNQVGIFNLTPQAGWLSNINFKRAPVTDDNPIVARGKIQVTGIQVHNNVEFR